MFRHPSVARRLFTFAALSFALAAEAATLPQNRIPGVIDDSARTTLPGTLSPRALPQEDIGAVAPGMPLQGMSLVFSRSAAQQADLDQLLSDLQDPSSPVYHQWLTPDQFAARFGVSDTDLAKTEGWLQSQGFDVTGVSRSRDRIFFSGTAAQVNRAFRTEVHNFAGANGQTNFAPSTDLSVPVALAGVVRTVSNLTSFRPHPHVHVKPAANPNFTSSQTGNHFLTPKDIATIYDITPALNAGYNGTGQTIAVVGQSAVVNSDISNFQSAAGVPVRAPSLVLVPGTGTSTVVSGDETESDLDLEYTSGVATGASVVFVYTGSNTNYGVFDSLQYTVSNKLAPIISVSYGACETELSASDYSVLNGILAQAAAQGQTVIAASGDSGSTDCYEFTNLTTAQKQALAIDFPSDSQYVTGVGGAMFTAGAVAAGSSYWQAAYGTDVIGSALSYMPEQVWNDDSGSTISSGGGGISTFTSRPTWQTGVPGIASGSYRLTPDIALAASPDNPGYLYCSSDTKSTGITGSCSNGFRDSTSNHYLTIAGGTSFAAPVFSGMLAILNQRLNSTGQGNINSILYTLASDSATYASAFHDITAGSNACLATTVCSSTGAGSFSAGVGYDSATGLGSIDFNNLMNAWPGVASGSSGSGGASGGSTLPKSFAVASSALTVSAGYSGASGVMITPANGYTGTVVFSVTTSANVPYLCYTLPNAAVTGTAPASSTLTVYTSQASCTATAGTVALGKPATVNSASLAPAPGSSRPLEEAAIALAGLLAFAGLRRRNARKLPGLLAVLVLAGMALGVTGCGGNTTPVTTNQTPPVTSGNVTAGTYALTITGTDSVTSSITSVTTVTLTVQ